MRTRSLLRNTMLSIVLVIVVLLRLVMWPLRLLRSAVGRLLPKGRKNKGIRMAGKWTLSQYR